MKTDIMISHPLACSVLASFGISEMPETFSYLDWIPTLDFQCLTMNIVFKTYKLVGTDFGLRLCNFGDLLEMTVIRNVSVHRFGHLKTLYGQYQARIEGLALIMVWSGCDIKLWLGANACLIYLSRVTKRAKTT